MPSVLSALRRGHPRLWAWQKAVGRSAKTRRPRRAQSLLVGTGGTSSGLEPQTQWRKHGRRQHSPENKQTLGGGPERKQRLQGLFPHWTSEEGPSSAVQIPGPSYSWEGEMEESAFVAIPAVTASGWPCILLSTPLPVLPREEQACWSTSAQHPQSKAQGLSWPAPPSFNPSV